ncbi:MAG: 50S ribosomal protein L29 [Bacillota bacterium]|jgi:large subunit ribosomal protein L29|nr:50S ribosomal protein L29 [Bacillota bacterium]
MKANTFRDMTSVELTQKLSDAKGELFNLRFQLATGQLENPLRIRHVKRDIARVKTVLREREINKG